MPANTVPTFTNVPVIGTGATGVTASPGLGGTGGVAPAAPVSILVGGTNGTRIEEITVVPGGTNGTVFAGTIINIFLFDSTTYWLEDQVFMGGFTAAVTLQPIWKKVYSNLILPGPTWSLAAAQEVTQAAGANIIITAKGGNF